MCLEVRVWRGSILESRHRFQAAVCDPSGRLTSGTEQPDRVTTFRSSAKPFQLLPLVERGHAERWGFRDEELAIMAASHTGSAYHVGLVQGILRRIGLDERHLACGYHEPIDPESLARVRAHPEDQSPLYNNCSGKHAGMLCLALSEGWPTAGYERAGHPVQQLMRQTIAEMCEVPAERLLVAVDGCSASVFGLPLAAMARAYARLAAARPRGEAREQALARIRSAMTSYPVAVGGEERWSTVLMQRTAGRLVSKGGAEGLACLGIPERDLGVAIKCEDGQSRGIPAATIALLEHLGELIDAELESLASWRRTVVTNHAGLEVGVLEAMVESLAPLL